MLQARHVSYAQEQRGVFAGAAIRQREQAKEQTCGCQTRGVR
ncbi:MAG TPA: hypothetical protein PLP66_03375 [Phycisphaerae bacterium]|nr:hypothetical protein [Phycisphaerae bacterium]